MASEITIDPALPHAFLSYTRFDDDFLDGGISSLRAALELNVRARTGKPFNIFQDVDDIKPGDIWRQKLDQAIQAAQLFIPILTPNFFNSAFCRREAKAFLDYEARAGRGDLVLPIYLIDAEEMEDEALRQNDEIARELHDRQYADWRSLQFRLQAAETKPQIYELAGAIASASARTNRVDQGPDLPTTTVDDEIAALRKEIAERDQAIEAERSNTERLEAELAERRREVDQLAEERATFLGQIDEQAGSKSEAATSVKLRERLSKLEQAFKKERSKTQRLAKELEDSKDQVGQLTLERAILESDAEDARSLQERVQQLEEEREQKGKKADDDLQSAQSRENELSKEIQSLTERLQTYEQASGTTAPSISKHAIGQIRVWLERLTTIRVGRRSLYVTGAAALTVFFGLGVWTFSPQLGLLPSFAPGDSFKDCDVCPEMVVVPAGTFLMGSPEGQGEDDERPQHEVTIAAAFALGKYEVTFAEWDACVAAGGCDHKPDDQGWGRDRRPVVDVGWVHAQRYVNWLSKETGETYRLPSEAQWEYAARAASNAAYPWGDSIGRNQANCSGCGSQWDGRQSAPVGSFEPNSFGLYDMIGNVWEWSQDVWHDNYGNASADGSPRETGANVDLRMVRGGSWRSTPTATRAANRYSYNVGATYGNLGFRVLRIVDPSSLNIDLWKPRTASIPWRYFVLDFAMSGL